MLLNSQLSAEHNGKTSVNYEVYTSTFDCVKSFKVRNFFLVSKLSNKEPVSNTENTIGKLWIKAIRK